jgi:peptide/nickel transport system permease protein
MKLNDWILNKHLRIRESPLYYKISVAVLSSLVFIGVFNSLLCNEKPLIAKTMEHKFVFPAFDDFKSDFGIKSFEKRKSDEKFIFALYPPIRYSFDYINPKQLGAKPPYFTEGKKSRWYTNWLGTEELGRDVIAGLSRGLYHTIRIAILATLFSIIIGSIYGMVIGYVGDNLLYRNLAQIIVRIFFILLIFFYLYYSAYFWAIFALLVGELIYKIASKLPIKKYSIPMDTIGVGIVTLRKSIPSLILIFALLPLFKSPSNVNTIIILSLIGWTGIAWIVRLQTMEIASKDYIKSAQSMGVGFWKMIIYHIYPNVKNVILLLFIFQLGTMITIEAVLSYLGVGIEPTEISLGTLLKQAKTNINAWWLAVFPGLMLCIILLCLHLIYTYHQSQSDNYKIQQ